MSIHMHLRAVAESEVRDDHTWLAAFMWEAWESLSDEYATGIAVSVDKVWGSIHDLYAAADVLDADSGEVSALPIYGGRPVAHSVDADPSNPPLGILESPGVSQAAVFLARVSFDELWNVASAKLVWAGSDEAEVRQEFFDHHTRLKEFYGRAATAGHAVVRAVWA
ncbi:DUF1877 family protein [Streptomyces sp. NPDC003393]